jgi:hypothetical protein
LGYLEPHRDSLYIIDDMSVGSVSFFSDHTRVWTPVRIDSEAVPAISALILSQTSGTTI